MRKIIVFLLLIATTILSCGKNGEITKSDDPGILPTPEIDAPIDDSEPALPPNIEITNNLECPDCPSTICCPEDEEEPTDCENDPTIDDPADPSFDLVFIPNLLFNPVHLNFLDDIDPDDEENYYNDTDWPEACLDIGDTDSHWWLVYIMTGGILAQVEFDEIDYISETTDDGLESYKAMALPGSETIKLEMDYALGNPQLTDTALSFIPDNYSLTYHYLTYDDPILGEVTIDGSLTCEGETHYYAETEGWYRHHDCTSTDNHFIVFIKGTKYVLDFDIVRQFNGTEFFLAGHTFPDGELTINNVRYDIDKTLPMSVSLCLRFSGTEDSRK